MKISTAQISVVPGDVKGNTDIMLTYVGQAKGRGADVIVFPKMADTGYDLPLVVKTAQDWNKGTVPSLKKAAAEHRINIVAGVSERVSEGVYNTNVIINREGEVIGAYRKTHLCTNNPPLEHHFLQAGNKLEIFGLEDTQCGFMTCYDIRFPEIARTLTIKGAKILFITSAFSMSRIQHWEILLAARAIENQVFVVACNRIGTDAGMTFCGASTIIDPYGTIVSIGSAIHEGLITGEINLDMINALRSQYKVLEDRRPALYSC